MPILSLAHTCLLPATPPETVRIAAEAGFDALGLRVERATPEDLQFPIRAGTSMMRETKQILDGTGLKVLDAEVFRLISGERFDRYGPALEACAELGARELLTTCNIKDHAEAVDLLSEACDVAGEFGLNLNIEFMTWMTINDLKAVNRLLDAVNRDNAVLLVDTLHVHRSNVTIEELATADRSKMRYIQICDATTPPPDFETMLFQARFERLMPGDGVLPLEAYMQVLPRDLPISVESPMRGHLAEVGSLAFAQEAYRKARVLLDKVGW